MPLPPKQVFLQPSFSLLELWDAHHFLVGGTMGRLKASGTCLPLPSFSCWGISVLVRRCGNNPLSSRPFLYRHDPESEGKNTEDCQPPCWVQTPLRLIERKGQRSQPGVTGPDRLNILIDLLPLRERQCSLTLKVLILSVCCPQTGSNSSSATNKLCDLCRWISFCGLQVSYQ